MTSHSSGSDIYGRITANLIAAIEAGTGTFTLPWRRDGLSLPINIHSGRPYQGINILSLWCATQHHGFVHRQWGTYRQWLARGAQVRRGERGTLILFYRQLEPGDVVEDETPARRFIARASTVFAADQVEGYTPPVPPLPPQSLPERLEHVDAFISATGAKFKFAGDRAFYDRAADTITLPDVARFIGSDCRNATEAMYGTALHELTHWSGAAHRLNRQFGQRFGDGAYAAEELVAEIGAAFLCAHIEISQDVRPDHANYLSSWLQLLKSDSRAIVTAASKASEAADYLRRFSERDTHHLVPTAPSIANVATLAIENSAT